jgi:DNA helicase HerA-like ATPase
MSQQDELSQMQLLEDIEEISGILARTLQSPRIRQVLQDGHPALARPQTDDRVLVVLALLADCLRATHLTMNADGQVTDEELEHVFPVLYLTSSRFAHALGRYAGHRFLSHGQARAFLTTYEQDTSPFGLRPRGDSWPGLELCRLAALAGDEAALDAYERMILRLVDEVARVGGDSAVREQSRTQMLRILAERSALDQGSAAIDRRLEAFLTSPVEVFSAVAQAHTMYEPDPLDVEEIHADARAVFASLVDRATTPTHQEQNRMLLIRGDSGSGKTHLMRAFRHWVHRRRLGYVAYVQLQARGTDYARYLLGAVVDGLERPYDHPRDDRSGLILLADGLTDVLGPDAVPRVARLREEDWDDATLDQCVGELVDELLACEALAGFDPDLLRVLLYMQRRSPAINARALKYLRCEEMTAQDRAYLGDVAPRTGPDDPKRMIVRLGQLAWRTQGSALVLLLDQAEDTDFTDDPASSFWRAADCVRGLTAEIPCVVAVIACLDDLYQLARPKMSMSLRDRLERDPPPQNLSTACTQPQIEALVSHRLAWLYEQAGARHREEDPLFPYSSEALALFANRRLRDLLDFCHRHRAACRATGSLVDWQRVDGDGGMGSSPGPDPLTACHRAWAEIQASASIADPDSDEEILALVTAAVQGVRHDLPHCGFTARRDGELLLLDHPAGGALAVGVANKGFQRGAFAAQVKTLQRRARDRTLVLLRTSEFPRGKASQEIIAGLRRSGGRSVVIPSSDLRLIAALQILQQRVPPADLAEWQRVTRPVASLVSVRNLLDLDGLEAAPATPPGPVDDPEGLLGKPTGSVPAGGTRRATQPPPHRAPMPPPAVPSNRLVRLGQTSAFQAQPVELAVDVFCRHAVFLGAPGSGKTTAALTLIEQLLERGIPAILVDRKGDLAGYARPAFWEEPGASEASTARKRALRQRIEPRLFTPGSHGAGRPLAIKAIPDLTGIPSNERFRLVQYAASALADIAGISPKGTGASLIAILTKAIEILSAQAPHATMRDLVELIASRDDSLVAALPHFKDSNFGRLTEALGAAQVNNADLFEADGEYLDASALLAPSPGGRTALTIISTRSLGAASRVQLWVSRLLVELARHVARSPSRELQGVILFDEAEIYLPAGSARPPTKEPMQELLRRARSGGLGVFLSSQSPGDFDYKTRDLVTTWLVGKIGDRLSITKMRPLFEGGNSSVASKLPKLGTGQFFLMGESGTREVRTDPALLRTEQLSADEILELATVLRPS